jgi:hypothetical protein
MLYTLRERKISNVLFTYFSITKKLKFLMGRYIFDVNMIIRDVFKTKAECYAKVAIM